MMRSFQFSVFSFQFSVVSRPLAAVLVAAGKGMLVCFVFASALLCSGSGVTAWQGGGAVTLQIGSANDEASARNTVAQLKAAGHLAFYVRAEIPGKGTWYRVKVGRFASAGDAMRYARTLRTGGAFVTGYDGPAGAPFSHVPALPPPPPKPKPTEPANAKPKTPDSVPAEVRGPQPEIQNSKFKTQNSGDSGQRTADSGQGKLTWLPTSKSPKTSPFKPSRIPNLALTPPPETSESELPAPPPATAGEPPKPPETVASRTTVTRKPPLIRPRPTVGWLSPKLTPPNPALLVPPPETLPPMDMTGWVRQYLPTNTNLTRVFFVDPLHGWAAGTDGALLRTEDGGVRWAEQVSGTHSSVGDVFFTDALHGWLLVGGTVGSVGRDMREEQALLYTENGGVSWQHMAELDALCVYFVNQQVGYAAGNYGAVLRTENGGKSWTRCASPERALGKPVKLPDMIFAFSHLQFLDAERGWAVGNYYGEGITRPGGVFFTQDGGQTWVKRPLTMSATSAELLNLHFFDLSRGYLVAEVYRGDGRYVTLYLTNDGGATWTERQTSLPGYHSTTLTSALVGWTAGVAPLRKNGPPYEVAIWRTNDGGLTWQEETSIAGMKLYDVFFLDSGHGWAVGEGGLVLTYRF